MKQQKKIILLIVFFSYSLCFCTNNSKLHIFRCDGKYGFVDDKLNVIISPIYDYAENFESDNYAIVGNNQKGKSVIDKTGSLVDTNTNDCLLLCRLFDNVFYNNFDNYVYNLKTRRKSTYLNPVVSNPYYPDYLCPFDGWNESDNKAYIGLFDKEGKSYKVNLEIKRCYPIVDNFGFAITSEWNGIIIDNKSNIILRNIINSGRNPSEGLLPVITSSKSGYVNCNGVFIFECEFYEDYEDYQIPSLDYPFKEGIAVVEKTKNHFIIYDRQGNILMQDTYLYMCGCSSCGLILCQKEKNGKLGYIDKKGTQIFPFIFDEAESFENGYAIVKYEANDCLLDLSGNLFRSNDLVAGKKKRYKNIK